MVKKARSERAPRPKKPPRHIELQYERSPDFRFLAADGVLVRVHPGAVVIGFYVDDTRVVSQSADLIEVKGLIGSYKPGPMKEVRSRLEQVAVRMRPAAAAALAGLIQQKLVETQSVLAEIENEEAAAGGGPDK